MYERVSGIVMKGPRDLQKEVLDRGLCLACGACVNLCPYIDMVAGRAVMIEPCNLSEGRCYDFCPRTHVDIATLDRNLFGACRSNLAIGSNIATLKARATDKEVVSAAQYGGAVSALVAYALETGKIDAAVLSKSLDRIRPKPTLARNRKEVLECSGSKYIVCPVVTEVLEAMKRGTEKIGVVGTPCQVTALRKVQASKKEPAENNIRIVIGLFCTWALSPQAYSHIRDLAGSFNVMKLDVPPPPEDIFEVETEVETVRAPLDSIRKFIMPSCNVCFDMTSEFADISVGTVEGEQNWNTLIVRTRRGEDLLRHAQEEGVIETAPLEEEKLDHLYQASLDRKKRALKEMESKKVAYLTMREEDRSKLIS